MPLSRPKNEPWARVVLSEVEAALGRDDRESAVQRIKDALAVAYTEDSWSTRAWSSAWKSAAHVTRTWGGTFADLAAHFEMYSATKLPTFADWVRELVAERFSGQDRSPDARDARSLLDTAVLSYDSRTAQAATKVLREILRELTKPEAEENLRTGLEDS